MPARSDPYEVSLRAVYVPKEGHDYSDEHYLNVAEGSTELSGDSNSEITLELEHIPACRDEVDNTFTGVMDETELGCIDIETDQYDPTDDVELVQGQTRTSGATAGSQDRVVSGAEGERMWWRVNPDRTLTNSPSVQVAMRIEVGIEILTDTDRSGQELALEYHTGPSKDNLHRISRTEIYDADGQDGWGWATFTDIDRYFFDHGISTNVPYALRVIHGKEARDEPFSDGSDYITFLKAGDSTTRTRYLTHIFQPEDVPGGSNKQSVVSGQQTEAVDIRDTGNWQEELRRKMKQ